MIFRVYNVEFKQKKDVFLALGYSRAIGSTIVTRQYGGLENLIQKRLQLTDEKEITKQLTILRDKFYNSDFSKKDTGNYKRIDKLAYSCYLSAWNILHSESKDIILKSVASINNMTVEELLKHLV